MQLTRRALGHVSTEDKLQASKGLVLAAYLPESVVETIYAVSR